MSQQVQPHLLDFQKYKAKIWQRTFTLFPPTLQIRSNASPARSDGFRLDAEAARYFQGAHLISYGVNFQSSDPRPNKTSMGAEFAVRG